MGAVNVLLFMLVLMCEATDSDPFSLTCENVTGSVGEVLTLSCDVSWHHSDCCIRSYKFQYAEDDSDSVICREEFPSDCEQRPKLTCSYSSNETLTAKVKFFLQTTCGRTSTYFTVNIAEPIRPGIQKRDPFSSTCKHATGSVGEVLTLSCDVSWHRSDCCIESYKFQYAEHDNDTICKEEFPSPCEQRPKLTCSYSSKETLTANVKFYLQTKCEQTSTYFTVNITGTPNEGGHESNQIIIAAVSSFAIIIIFIIIFIIVMVVIRKCNSSGLQMNYEGGVSVSQK